jgi:NADH dehydrogenase [ubiquinone] 1 alpha subcomplex assembly factor 6
MIAVPYHPHARKSLWCARLSLLPRHCAVAKRIGLLRRNNGSMCKSDHSHCLRLVETRDREGFLCGLLLSSKFEIQKPYFAIRAFNIEVASIANSIDPRKPSVAAHPAKLRLQWWREAVDAAYNGTDELHSIAASHPVIRSISSSDVMQRCTRRYFEKLLDAREWDIERTCLAAETAKHVGTVVPRFTNVQELVNYAEDTMSSIIYLSLECCGVWDEEEAYQVASHVGVACGIVTALRSTAHLLSTRGEISIPSDILPKNISTNVLRQEDREALCHSANELACVAHHHLHEARRLQHNAPKKGWACFLPAVSALSYLEELQRCNFDVLHSDLHMSSASSSLKFPLLLGRAWLTGHF